MNSSYKLVYSEALNTWVAVAEHVSARGKKSAMCLVTAAALLAGGVTGTGWALAAPPLITPPAVNQLPTGAQVAAGTVSFSQTQTATAASMAVQQSSNQAIVNWQSFNVGANARVNITQPSASSVLLNRVQSSDPSQIFGQINANGQVFLTNPNGVYFAPGSRVDVGSFTATTHSISDSDFLSGNYNFSRNGATGSLLNEGSITSGLGGYIALLAPEVRNQGVVLAQMGGTLALAAGESYQLLFNSNKQLTNVLVTPATIETLIENGNAVQAPGGLIILSAQAASSLLGGVVKNSGSISATGLVNDGGTIRLTATNKIELTSTSTITADAAPNSSGNGGRIDIITDLGNATGITQVDGSISAKGGELGGDGGFVDTSAARLAIGETTLVTTGASMGNAGTWLLDPYDITIEGSSGTASGTTYANTYTAGATSTILASSINNALSSGTNVTIATGTLSSTPTVGSITLKNADLSWSTSASLTLSANYNINVGTSSSTGSITLGGNGTLYLNPNGSTANTNQNIGYVLMGMASSPTGGPTGNGFNGQINVSSTAVAAGARIFIGGTQASVINTESQFTGTNWNTTAGLHVLGSDIAFTNSYTSASPGGQMQTKLNGLGHSISGLNVTNYSGLFSALYGQVANLGGKGNITVNNGASNIGGLFTSIQAYGYGNHKAINTYAAVNITLTGASSTRYIGGFAGSTTDGDGASVRNSYSTGNISATGTGSNNANVGGFLGGFDNLGNISNSYSTGNVSATGFYNVGGFVGGGATGASGSSLTNVYATGNVSGNSNVGGLIGSMYGVTLSNAFATGNVSQIGTSSPSNTGGLVGAMQIPSSGSNSINQAYATGTVTCANSNYCGGLVGQVSNGTISNAYWNSANAQVTSGSWTSANPISTSSFATSSNLSNFTFSATTWGYNGGLQSAPIFCTFQNCLNYSSSNVVNTFSGVTGSFLSNTSWSIAAPTLANIQNYGITTIAISSGTVTYDINSITSFSLPISIATGASISFLNSGASSNSSVVSGLISGSGSVNTANTFSGTVTLSGSNTYTGGTTISAGTLKAGSAAALGTGAVSIGAAGKLDLTYSGTVALGSSLSMSAGATITNSANTSSFSVAGTSTLAGSINTAGNQTYTGAVTLGADTSLSTLNTSLTNTNGTISFSSTFDSASASYYGLSVTNGTGITAFAGIVGANSATSALGYLCINATACNASTAGTASGNGTTTLAGNVTTSGTQTYGGALTLGANTALTSTANSGNGVVTIAGNVNTSATVGFGMMEFLGNGYWEISTNSGSTWAYYLSNGSSSTYQSSITIGGTTYSSTATALSSPLSITFSSGTYSFAPGSQFSSTYLVVGGGGGGGFWGGGGGGGGGVLQSTTAITLGATSYSIVVGAGGAGATASPTTTGTIGSSSSVIGGSVNLIAYGGGGGGHGQGTGGGSGSAVGAASGGGSSFAGTKSGGTGLSGQGNSGGSNSGTTAGSSNGLVAGGGGAASFSSPGAGGAGATNLMTGSNIGQLSGGTYYVAGGGGGSSNGAGAAGGLGGGGKGAGESPATSPVDGTANTGGGGGGAWVTGAGGSGGSGVVILNSPTTQNSYTLTINSGSGKASIGGSVSNVSTLTINSTSALSELAGVVGGSTALVKSGAGGVLNLSGTNTYTGGTTISAGTLKLGNAAALGGSGGAVSVAAGAALDLNGTTVTNTNTLTLRGTGISDGGALTNSSSSGATYAGNIALGSASSIGSAVGDITASGVVSGAFALTKVGAASLSLTGSNSYTGGTTISAGTLKVGSGSALGSSGGGAISVASLAALDLNGFSLANTNTLTLNGTGISSGGALINSSGTGSAISNPIVLGSDTSIGSSTNSINLSGVISGAGNLTKIGSANSTLSGINTYTGTTTVTGGGILAISHAQGLGSTDGGTIVSSTGRLLISGLSLGAEAITLNGGSLEVTSGTTSLSGPVTLGANSTVRVDSGAQLTLSGLVDGTGRLTKGSAGTGTLVLTGTNTYSGGTTITAGTLQLGAGGTTGSIAGNVTNNATLTFNRSDDLSFAGAISGTGAVTKSAANTLTFSGTNTYTGGTTISAGTLQIGAGSTTGSITGDVTNNATLALSRSDALSFSGVISGTGALTKLGTGTTTLSGINTYTGSTTVSTGALAISNASGLGGTAAGTTVSSGATLDLQGVSVGAEALTINGGTISTSTGTSSLSGTVAMSADSAVSVAGTQLTLSGVVSGIGFGLTKTGSGSLILSGTNTYTGATTVSAGTLAITNAAGLGGTGAGTSVASGATLDLQGVSVGAEALTINGGTISTSTGTSSLSGTVAMSADSAVSVAGTQLTLSGVVSGIGFGLTKTGSGSLILSGTNTYTGATTVSAGTLSISNAAGLGGTGAGTSVASGATLDLRGVTVGAEAITLNGGTLTASTGTSSLSGTVAMSADSTASVAGTQLTLSGVVSGIGFGLTKTGSGSLILSGTNTYTGATTISAGTLQVGDGSTSGSITGDVSNSGALTFNRSDALTYSGAIGGSGSVTKLEASALTLSGANTYTGGTTISVGTLKAGSATAFGTGAISVVSGAALDLNGQTMTSTGALTLRSTGISSGGALLNSSSTGATYAGLLTLGAASSIVGGTGTIALSNTGTITGATYGLTLGGAQGGSIASIIGTTSGTVTKQDAGTWLLSGSNTYTGATTISAGTLATSSATGLGTIAGGVTVASAATLDLRGASVGAESITLNGGTLATSTGTSSLTGTVAMSADSAVSVAGTQLTLSGVVSGIGFGLTKTGNGILVFSGSNSYTGTTTVSAGTLAITNASGLGTTAAGTTVASGATLDLRGVAVGAEAVTLNGGTLTASTGTSSLSGAVNLTSASLLSGAGALTLSGAITSNSNGLAFLGTGAKTLSSTSNTLSTIATGSSVGALSVVNNAALTIGQVTAGGSTYSGINATDTVSVSTRTGDLTVSQNVATTSTATSYTTPALKLGAGSLSAAGTPTGGDVLLSGTPTISVGTGGAALIYSGYATTSDARTLVNSFSPKLAYYSINTNSSSVPTVVAAAYFTLFRESPITLYTLYVPGQRFTYGTPISSLNYCYSTSASSCSPVTAAGIPSTTQAAAFNNLLLDAGTYPGSLNPTAPDVRGYFFAAGNAVNIVVDPKTVTIANSAQTTTYNGLSTYTNLANAMAYTVTGLVGYDAVSSLTQTPSGSGLVASQVANAGSFTVTPGAVVLSTGKTSNYTFSYTAATATVNKADLKVTANNDTKFIGEADVSGYNGVSYSGFVAGQTASVLSGTATVARSNAGVGAAGTYTGVLSAAGSTLSSNNYNLIYEAGSYTIVPADQLLIRLGDASTTYGTAPSYTVSSVQYKSSTGNAVVDLTSRATVNAAAFTLADGAGGNTALSLGPVNASLSSAGQVAAGSYQVGASSITNTSANYGNTVNIVGALTVAQKTLTPVATSGLSKTYDGTTTMSSLGFGLTGLVGGDAVTATGLGTYANANAGNAKAFTVAGIGLGGTDSANYKLAANTISATNGVITTAPLLIKANNDSKTYDASAYAATAGVSYSGFVNSETATDLGGTLAYGGSAIGAVNVGNYVITPSGQTSSNYAISFGNGSLYISPADVSVSATNVALTGTVGKVYDGTNVATLTSSNYVITGWQGSDGATITQTTGTYDSANAGKNKLVSVTLASSDYSATGSTLLSNYNLPTAVSGNVGVISPKTVAVTNAARSTTYDGVSSYSTLGSGTSYSVGTMVGSDALASVTQTPSGFSGAASGAANAGTFTVAPSAAVLATGSADNYSFSYVASTNTVSPKAVNLTISKTYDASTAFTNGNTYSITGMVNSETAPTITSGTANTSSANAATYSSFSNNTLALSNGNYTLSGGTVAATISPAALSAALVGTTSKAYDGNIDATLAAGNFALTGFVNAEGASVSRTLGTFNNADAGTGKTVLVALSSSDYSAASGSLLSNYILPTSASGSIGTITLAPVVSSTPVVVLPPAVMPASAQNYVPPSLTVSAVSSAVSASSSAVSSARAGGSSSGVSVSTISSASAQVPGLVTVLIPTGTAPAGSGFVIALPEQVVSSGAAGASVQVTLPNNEPLPAWIRYDAATQTLVTSAVPAGAFPLSVVVTEGGQSTVIQISESQSSL